MKLARTIVWLLAGISVLVVANLMLMFEGSEKTSLVPRTSLMTIPDSDVSMLEISRGGEVESVLTRTGSWRLVEPFSGGADESVVLRLIDALAFAPVEDPASDLELLKLGRTRADFGLNPPRLAVRVRADGAETTIAFGLKTPTGSGVYASVSGVPAVFVVPSNTLAAVDIAPAGFRSRSLLAGGEGPVASVDIKCGSGEFLSFRREGEGWFMTQPTNAPASTERIRKLLSDISSSPAIDFVWPVGGSNEVSEASAALLAGYGLDAESAVTVTLKGKDGADRRISFGADAQEGSVYALVHNGATIVTVDRSLKEEASLGNSAFADARIFPYEAAQVTGLSLNDGGVLCLLAKDESGVWRMDAPVSAAASAPTVDALVSSVLALRSGDMDESGVEISLGAGDRAVRVSRAALGPSFRLEELRSREMLNVDVASIRRLMVSGAGRTISIVYDADRRAWNVETSPVAGTVRAEALARLLAALSPLTASRVEKLKISAEELGGYGLDNPYLTIAIDLVRTDAIRRNVLIGDPVEGGRFATIGAADAVFVLPDEVVGVLSAELVGE